MIQKVFEGANIIAEDTRERPFREGLDWSPLDGMKSIWLERPFEEDKAKDAICSLENGKASGLDEFNLAFFQAC